MSVGCPYVHRTCRRGDTRGRSGAGSGLCCGACVEPLSSCSAPPPPGAHNLVVDPVELERGGTVRAGLKGEHSDCRPGSLEVGLVCREFYDTRVDAYGREGSPVAQRVMIDAVAYEEWQAANDRDRPYSFTVPVDAPYSYEGICLSFAWSITTRYRTQEGLPVEQIMPLWVRP